MRAKARVIETFSQLDEIMYKCVYCDKPSKGICPGRRKCHVIRNAFSRLPTVEQHEKGE